MIELQHVSKNFNLFKAVDDVSFSIPAGQIVGLLGPNGAGKTTTMRMITGFFTPSSGEIIIDGKNVKDDPVSAKQKIGYMPESAPIYGDMIVSDYLAYVAEMHGVNADEKLPLLCKECGLKEVMHKNFNELSRGYRQRVGLAHALMNDPKILILDEPTSGLDPNQIEDVRSLIKEIGKTRTVIVSTHILGEVEMICDRVIIISGGKLVADGATDEIKSRFSGNTTIFLDVRDEIGNTVTKDAFAALDFIASASDSNENGVQGVVISAKDGKDIRSELFDAIVSRKWKIFEMSLKRNSLEDVFHTLTK